MLNVFRRARADYPRQFWLMFWGMLISSIGASMIWPFLMVYVSERLSLPMTAIAGLMTLSSVMGLIASFVAGPVVDRFGRKWVMVISLVMNAAGYVLMSTASTFAEFAILMAINGIFNPLYRIGADAMIADLIPAEKRPDAYSLTRIVHNVGVALGPAAGGFIAAVSYSIAFYIAGVGMLGYGLLMAFGAIETLPARDHSTGTAGQRELLGGYGSVLRDRPFIGFVISFTLTMVAASLVWVLLAVYAKQNFGMPESQYGFLPTTNALMVIAFQYFVTQITKRYSPLPVVALGALFYAVACGSMALAQDFWGFWIGMLILTVGELMIMPTSSTHVALLAPADKRGRYMSLFGLTWSMASGIGPVFGGVLNDNLGPQAIWYGGALVGFVGVLGFILMAWRHPHTTTQASAKVEAL